MLDATMLATYDEAAGKPLDLFGVWIPRKGDNGLFTVELAANYDATLTVTIFQKNYADVGNGTTSSVSVSFAQAETGRKTMELLGAKEVIRFKLSLDRGGDLPDPDLGWILFRFLQPVWFEAVKV